jgi:ParB/RepB/Spo0J family partition protein
LSEDIAISDIAIEKKLLIRADPEANIATLKPSIKERGLDYAISVRRAPPDFNWKDTVEEVQKPYLLTKGYCRLKACEELGQDKIKADVKDMDGKAAILETISENLDRANLSPKEEALAFKAAIMSGWKIPELANKRNVKPEWIEQRLAILNLDKQTQEFVHEGKLGPKVLEKAVFPVPKPIQALVAREIVTEGYDLREAESHANRRTQQYEDEQIFQDLLAKSEHKKCPTCNKPASRKSTRYGRQYAACKEAEFDYGGRHEWNLNTGKTAAEESEEQRKKEKEERTRTTTETKDTTPHLTHSFRLPVPARVLHQAFLKEAVNIGLRQLKQGAKKSIELRIDGTYYGEGGTHISVDALSANGPVISSATLHEPKGITAIDFEEKKYSDGNLVKITPSHNATTQNGIDQENERVEKYLRSLPEIAAYLKTHKKQKTL